MLFGLATKVMIAIATSNAIGDYFHELSWITFFSSCHPKLHIWFNYVTLLWCIQKRKDALFSDYLEKLYKT